MAIIKASNIHKTMSAINIVIKGLLLKFRFFTPKLKCGKLSNTKCEAKANGMANNGSATVSPIKAPVSE